MAKDIRLKELQAISQNSLFPPEIQAKRLHNVIENELTETQRTFITEYYFNNRSLRNIAAEYGVQPSSVFKTIRRGLNRIARCLKY